jgi:hypothetical protein
MLNKYSAPPTHNQLPCAREYPAVHSGGMSAVAIATPGTTFEKLRRVSAMIPAQPPKKAINTSQRVGLVRASNSGPGSFRGLI